MKLTKLFSKLWLSAAALLAFSACSNEDLPTQTTSEAPKTKQIYVNLSAGQDQLRVAYGLATDGSGATTGLQMSDKNVVIRVAVRQGDSEPIYQDIEFTKTANRNHATYSGKITVPNLGSGKYTISGVLLSEVGGRSFAKVAKEATTPQTMTNADQYVQFGPQTSLVLPASSTVLSELNVPYVTKWQTIEATGDTANPVHLVFEPQGTILRLRIKNEGAATKQFYQVKFGTNAFVNQGTFIQNETRDNMPAWYPSNTQSMIFNIPNGISVASGQFSPWLYVWVMPRKFDLVGRNTEAGLGLEQNSALYHTAFATKQSLPLGSVPMTLIYRDGHQASFGDGIPEYDGEWGVSQPLPKLSIEYLSQFAYNTVGDGLVTDHVTSNPNVGFFFYKDAVAKFKSPSVINGVKYSMPTVSEMASIVPPEFDQAVHNTVLRVGTYAYDVVERNIKIGSVTQNYKADYYRTNTVTYGIRFKSQSNYNRTAFKYSTEGDKVAGNRLLKIYCIYLGAEQVSIEDVAKESFWTARASDVKVRTLPYYGTYLSTQGEGIINKNRIAFFLTADRFDEAAVYIAAATDWSSTGILGGPIVGPGSELRKYPVLPFIRD